MGRDKIKITKKKNAYLEITRQPKMILIKKIILKQKTHINITNSSVEQEGKDISGHIIGITN